MNYNETEKKPPALIHMSHDIIKTGVLFHDIKFHLIILFVEN